MLERQGRGDGLDVATLIGSVLGLGLLLGATALSGSLSAFFDLPSLLIVFGGTVAATFINESLSNVVGALRVAKHALFHRGSDSAVTISHILELSQLARHKGILALADVEVPDVFLAKGVRLAVSGLEREEIRETLHAELVSMKQRHLRGQRMFKFMGSTAPAMGMIGTLIGLVQMLQTLNDPSRIGPAMAIALLTTLYGAVTAFLVCNPIAAKLERRSSEESANMSFVIEAVDSIVRGNHSTVIQDKLQARLAPKESPIGPTCAAGDMRLEEEPESTPEEGAPAWMTTFSDMVVLFLCFFVLLLSFARTDTANFDSALGSVRQALGAKPSQARAPTTVSERAALAPSPSATERDSTRDQAVVERLTQFLAARGLRAQVEVAPSERGIVLRTHDQILFDSGAAELKQRGLPVLAAVCELARHFRGQLAVEGHTDDRPIQSALFPSNWELSGARSAVVLRYLLAEQIQPELLHMAGYADRRPIASNETEEGRTKNRRVEFVFEYERGANPEALFEL